MSHRQRMFAVHRRVQAIIGGSADRIALGWVDDGQVVARLRVGRGFRYRTFVVPAEDELMIADIVAWAHAESPKTS